MGPIPSETDDQMLGRRIGKLLATRPRQSGIDSTLLAHVQDLLGADGSLLLPLRDLLTRPALRRLLSADSAAQRLAGRDGLLADLLLTYQPAVVERLGRVLDGMLELPPSAIPVSGHRPRTASPAAAAAPPVPAAEGQQSAGGRNGAHPLPILVVSLAVGVGAAAMAWLLLSARQGSAPIASSTTSPAQAPAPAAPQDPPASQPPAPAGLRRQASADSGTPWGDANSYKHGILPGGDHPQTCAFSRSDVSGSSVTELHRMEFWACRDLGGDPANGIRIRWSDRQETTYRFVPGGSGSITGTAGETFPIRWRNSDYQGRPIIVIEHQDRGESWIPGRLEEPAG